MHLRPRLPLVATAAAAVALLLVLGGGALAQQEPEQEGAAGDRLSSRPSVGYRYRVETVNAREATVVSLEVSTHRGVLVGLVVADAGLERIGGGIGVG